MIGNALLTAAVFMLALLVYLMQECQFLITYKSLLWYGYGKVILLFLAAVFFNSFAAFYWLGRKLFLKDTGQKLAHLEKQLRGGEISEELARRLKE